MKDNDWAITLGLLFCLAVAILGLFLGSGYEDPPNERQNQAGVVLSPR